MKNFYESFVYDYDEFDDINVTLMVTIIPKKGI